MISFLITYIYVMYIVIKYGIPHSLSATYYLIKNKWIFSTVLAVSAGLILPILVTTNYSFLIFIALAGIFFVAFAPDFKSNSLEDNVHTYSAIISLISSQIWVALNAPIVLLLWIPYIVYLILDYIEYGKEMLEQSCFKFWAEIVMLLTVYLTFL